jgi:REase associating with pPIWI_RE/pPIWI_RE three-gene island domain Y
VESETEDTEELADVAQGWAPGHAEDDDYRTIMLLASGLAGIRRVRARIDAGEHARRASAEAGLLPVPWRSGMVRLWWRFHRSGVRPPTSDLEVINLCRRPFGEWPVQLRISAADMDVSLLDGDELSPLAEQALDPGIADVEAELVEREIFAELLATAETNGVDGDMVQAAYVCLRRFLIDHPVISDREAQRLVQRFPACARSGQPFVRRFLNAAYDSRRAQGTVSLQTCSGCGNLLDGRDEACGTAGCSGRAVASTIWVLGAYHVQHRATRRFFHDPGLLEARLIDRIREGVPADAVAIEEWPGLEAYDIRLSFSGNPRTGRPEEVWGADAKDQVSPGLLGTRFRWKDEPPCDRRFLVLPTHRARQPGYVEDLDVELEGRVTGVVVIDEETFIARVLDQALEASRR